MLGHGIEPMAHALLKLRLCIRQHFAHTFDLGVEGRHALFGGEVNRRRARAQQQREDGDDADRYDQGENDEKGFRHGQLLP